jgi:hypothetical protein
MLRERDAIPNPPGHGFQGAADNLPLFSSSAPGGLARGTTAVVEGFVHNVLDVYTSDATSVYSVASGE